jgi:class 3 adenylate cyclase
MPAYLPTCDVHRRDLQRQHHVDSGRRLRANGGPSPTTRQEAHRIEFVEPAIAAHRGGFFKLMGDGLLAEFASVVNAVECAVDIQRGMAERNSGEPVDQRIDLTSGGHRSIPS